MIFKELILHNWIPYKGTHSIKFASGKKNVTLIKARNQRGKTSLLLAFRWALYGKTGAYKYPDYISILNREAKNNGDLNVYVTLKVEKNKQLIEISRKISGRKTAKTPLQSDFNEEFIISIDGIAISENPDSFISEFMSDEISEFFLFNGEDLDKYKELGRTESKRNTKLKNAIERVIQTPFLKEARNIIGVLKDENFDVLERNSEDDLKVIRSKIKHLAGLQKSFQDQKDELEISLDKAKFEFREAKSNWDNISEKYETAIDLNTAENALESCEEKINTNKASVKENNEIAYKIIAKTILQNNIDSKDIYQNALQESRGLILKKSLLDGICALRNKELESDDIKLYEDELNKVRELISDHSSDDLAKYNQIIGITQDMDTLVKSNAALQSSLSNLTTSKIEVRNLKEELGNTKNDDINKIKDKYDNSKEEKESLEKAINEIDTELNGPNARENQDVYDSKGLIEKKAAYESVEKTLSDKVKNKSMEEKLDILYKKLENIYNNSINDLSNNVKDVIHEEGNKLYKKMLQGSTNNSLKINSDYGLDLVDSNNEKISDSAGGDQIAIMSLFHGLKKATGVEGPIVVDTPLARMDEENSTGILRELPKTATQCILLAQAKEIPDGGQEEEVLNPNIGLRYEIEKLSDTHSEIIEK